MRYHPISRRHLLQATGIAMAGGASLSLQSCSTQTGQTPLRLYLTIDEYLTFILPRSEMGQDVMTSFAMLIAEELEAPLDLIRVRLADASESIPDQMTVGSSSIRNWWRRLRYIGANTKALLIRQAAIHLSTPENELFAEQGYVISQSSGKKVPYSQLLQSIEVPGEVANSSLKQTDTFNLVGTSPISLFNQEKVTGDYRYVNDWEKASDDLFMVSIAYQPGWPRPSEQTLEVLRMEHQLTAAISVESPIGRYDYRVFLCHGKTWPLLKAKEKLETEKLRHLANEAQPALSPFEEKWNEAQSKQRISQEGVDLSFKTPAVAHAPMEPPGARMRYTPQEVVVWAPTQAPDKAREAIAKRLNMDLKHVTLHTLPMGGGFGRKRYTDYLKELAVAAEALYHSHVKQAVTLLWSREDELSREHYRPATLQQVSWAMSAPETLSFSVIEGHKGAKAQPPTSIRPDIPIGLAISANSTQLDHYFSTGIWRSVHHGYHAFALCSAIDEICHQMQKDPIEYYLENPLQTSLKNRAKQLLKGDESTAERLNRIIRRVKEMAGWHSKSRQGLGFATYSAFGSHIALIAQVMIKPSGELKVTRVWAAIDCGLGIHPDRIKAQLEGGILFGLSACLYGGIPAEKNAMALNFDVLPVLRMSDAPEIDIAVIKSDASPTGVGELGVPPIAPAICNAIRDLSPHRFTQLPLIKKGKINFDNALQVNHT